MSCDLCIYCGGIAYKTNGSGQPICYDFAYTGRCNNPALRGMLDETNPKAVHKEPGRIYGINKNTACPCGSGKKYKHCCLNKKE